MPGSTIALDVSCLLKPLTGVGIYTDNLVRALLRRPTAPSYVLWANALRGQVDLSEFPRGNWVQIRTHVPGKLLLGLWEHCAWPKLESLTGRCDVFHSPNFFYHRLRSAKSIATVHDLFFMRHPELTERFGGKYFARVVPRRIADVDAIIAVSQSTANDLVELLQIPRSRIRVISEAADPAFANSAGGQADLEILQGLGLERPFVLAVGTIEPRKNLPFLVRVLAKWPRWKQLGWQLVIVGGAGWGVTELNVEVDRWKAAAWVRRTDYVDQRDLAALYRQCQFFAFPSLYEGFGLPLLEAMMCGAPVIASRCSSVPEIAGDAALLVDPNSEDMWMDGMEKLACDMELRQRLAGAGRAQARNFSWDKAAAETEALYRQFL